MVVEKWLVMVKARVMQVTRVAVQIEVDRNILSFACYQKILWPYWRFASRGAAQRGPRQRGCVA